MLKKKGRKRFLVILLLLSRLFFKMGVPLTLLSLKIPTHIQILAQQTPHCWSLIHGPSSSFSSAVFMTIKWHIAAGLLGICVYPSLSWVPLQFNALALSAVWAHYMMCSRGCFDNITYTKNPFPDVIFYNCLSLCDFILPLFFPKSF